MVQDGGPPRYVRIPRVQTSPSVQGTEDRPGYVAGRKEVRPVRPR